MDRPEEFRQVSLHATGRTTKSTQRLPFPHAGNNCRYDRVLCATLRRRLEVCIRRQDSNRFRALANFHGGRIGATWAIAPLGNAASCWFPPGLHDSKTLNALRPLFSGPGEINPQRGSVSVLCWGHPIQPMCVQSYLGTLANRIRAARRPFW
jgi:hypothetical protein